MQIHSRVQAKPAKPSLAPLASSPKEQQYQKLLRESTQLIQRFFEATETELGFDDLKSLRRDAKRIYGRLSKTKQAPFFLARLEAIEFIWETADAHLDSIESPDMDVKIVLEEDWLAELEHLIE